MYEPDMIGAIKIKDGLFIGDELASQVSLLSIELVFHFDNYHTTALLTLNIGSRICGC